MIIEEYIVIEIGYRNINYFKELGYDAVFGVNISVLSTHLTKTSNTIIHAKCDVCGEEIELKKTNYTKSLKSHNYYCCQKCASYKVKKTFLEKYGVDNVFQNEKIKDKIKKTNLKKYGFESPQQNKEIRHRTEETNLKKYRAVYTFQSDEVKEKIKETNLNRYGVEHPQELEKIKDKVKQTNLERYGVEYTQQNKEIRIKTKNKFGKIWI